MAHSASQCFHGRSPTATPVGPCARAALKCVGSCSHSMSFSHEPVVTRTGGWAGLGMGVEGRDEASRPVRQSARRHSGAYLTVGPPASASIAFFALKQKTIMGI